MSCTKSDFAEIAQPRRRRDRGIGEHPNKQENVRPRESGSRAIFRKCIYTCIACRFLAFHVCPFMIMLHLEVILLLLSGTVFSMGMNHLPEGGVL